MKPKPKNRSVYESIQIKALADVEEPDLDYSTRRVQRLFSTTFHVSILETEALTLEYMLRHIFENRYEQMSGEDRIKASQSLLKTPEIREQEHQEDVRRLDQDDLLFFHDQQLNQQLSDKKKSKKSPK